MRDDATVKIEQFPFKDDEYRVSKRGEREALGQIKNRVIGVSRWAIGAPRTLAAHASHDEAVLIKGEAGVGKAFVARLVHECGRRRNLPFVVMSCETVAEEVVETVLTGASGTTPLHVQSLQREYLERARGGTLYVEGATRLSGRLREQVGRYLRQSGMEGTPLGERMIRVVFGVEEDGEARPEMESEETGRVVRIPPLRERPEDIELLCEYFVARVCQRMGIEERVVAPDAVRLLLEHDWPGNVSELKKVVEYMVRHSGPPQLDSSLLPVHINSANVEHAPSIPEEGINLQEVVREYEKRLLEAALEQCGGVQTKAARSLGMKVSTLNSKLAHYEIDAWAVKARHRRAG